MTGAFLGGVLFTLFIAFIVYKVREAKNKDRTGTGSGGGGGGDEPPVRPH